MSEFIDFHTWQRNMVEEWIQDWGVDFKQSLDPDAGRELYELVKENDSLVVSLMTLIKSSKLRRLRMGVKEGSYKDLTEGELEDRLYELLNEYVEGTYHQLFKMRA